jgi:hypothetical protein
VAAATCCTLHPTLIIRLLRTLYPFRAVFWPKDPQKPNSHIAVASEASASDRFNATISKRSHGTGGKGADYI